MKIRFFKVDYKELKRKLIQYGVLLFLWDLNQLLDKIGISIKKKYMEAEMQILSESNNTFLIIKMLDNGYLLFTYNKDKIKTSKEDFSEFR